MSAVDAESMYQSECDGSYRELASPLSHLYLFLLA